MEEKVLTTPLMPVKAVCSTWPPSTAVSFVHTLPVKTSQFVQWTHVKQQPNSSRGGHSVHLSGSEQTPAAVTTESVAATTFTTVTPQSQCGH